MNILLLFELLISSVDEKLSMHIARYPFGIISRDKIPIQMLQKLYRHSSVTTTIYHQANFMKKKLMQLSIKLLIFRLALL
tara:strand:+ start:122 stop:361 length:240 start_codon:yes stop_codon:yes gene_type:complete